MDDKDITYEPMDIDLSSQSANAMDISYSESTIETDQKYDIHVRESSMEFKPEIINELYVQNLQNRNTLPTRTKRNNISIVLLSLIFLLISFTVIQIVNFKCSEDFDLNFIRESLTRKIYGQSEAVKNIILAIEANEKTKILVLYGGTGVGKTYTTSLILENVLECNNIYHYTMPGFLKSFSSELMLGLLFCKSTVIIVDDLKRNDISNIKEPVNELIMKSQKLSKTLTIMLLYNCETVHDNFLRKCDDSFLLDVVKSFTGLDVIKYFIKFESLTETHLRKCIENELPGRIISVADFNKIVKNFNVTLDGCKGVYQRMKYLKNT